MGKIKALDVYDFKSEESTGAVQCCKEPGRVAGFLC